MANKLYLVTVQDTVLQSTGYFIRAENEAQARELQKNGMYMEETSTITLDTLETEVKDVVMITESAEGQALQ